jgi:hypothetical protein
MRRGEPSTLPQDGRKAPSRYLGSTDGRPKIRATDLAMWLPLRPRYHAALNWSAVCFGAYAPEPVIIANVTGERVKRPWDQGTPGVASLD